MAASLATGCGSSEPNSNTSANANASQTNSNATETNVEELGMLVNVPEVFWRQDAQHKKITAVLRLSQPEATKLIADAEKVRPPQQVNINPESWFPPELIAQGDTSGDDTLNGKSYAANAFFQDPYNEGRIIKIEDSDYFILEMNAK
jgi:hypothetical protein